MKKAHNYLKYAVTMMLAACMMLSPLAGAATAFAAELPETEVTETEVTEKEASETEEGPLYVLMNIPYDEFYEAEGVEGVDAVSTATVKTFNQTMAAGSYHDGYLVPDDIPGTDDAKILGVTYPVLVTDPSVLEGLPQVTDESTATITVAAGKSSLTTKEVTGIDVLFASPSYAYYVLADEPSSYKELTVQDGSFSFGTATAAAASETLDAEPSVSYTGHHTQIEISVSDEVISNSSKVNAVVMTTADGGKYALQHVVHVWRKSELGWNYDMFDLGGKTITSFKYYTETADENGNVSYAVTDYAVNIPIKANTDAILAAAFDSAEQISVTGLPEDAADPVATVMSKVGRGETPVVIAENVPVTDGKIAVADPVDGTTYTVTIVSDNYKDLQAEAVYEEEKEPVYVLMNIPYDKFYAAEGTEGVDAVSTASLKTYNETLAAGSYHNGYIAPEEIQGSEAARMLGVIYPVLVNDPSILEGLTAVTDESTATISVTAGRNGLTTKDVTGKDVLFASPSYAYYVLSSEPSSYKELTAEGGSFSFGAASAAAAAETLDAEPVVSYTGHHTEIEITLDDVVISDSDIVDAVVMTTDDGKQYVLRHIFHIWRKAVLGWDYSEWDLGGKSITSIRYFTETADEETGAVTYSITDYAVNIPIKLNTDAALAAAFDSAEQISVTGLPADIKNPVAKVQSKVGRGETPVVIAENVSVTDGKIAVTGPVDGTTYNVVVSSDNYKDLQAEAVYVKKTWIRLAGNGRYDTMSEIIKEGFSSTGGTVVVATGTGFKDALAAAGLAGLYDAPVILTDGKSLSSQAQEQLKRLAPSQVYIAGGEAAVSKEVFNSIKTVTGVDPVRKSGNDSAGTSAALATAGTGWSDTAIIATNKTFKDALSAAPISYSLHMPILLAGNGQSLNADVLNALKTLGIKKVIIVGGKLAVTENVENQLVKNGIAKTSISRIYGDTAVDTSAEIAKFGLGQGLTINGMGVATSQNYPDALAGAALCGHNDSVLLLADDKAMKNTSFPKAYKADFVRGYVFGGTLAVSDNVVKVLQEAVE